jgi:hypothetical protein
LPRSEGVVAGLTEAALSSDGVNALEANVVVEGLEGKEGKLKASLRGDEEET